MIVNRQRTCSRFRQRPGRIRLARARRALRLRAESLTVCLVTNSEIARWNRTPTAARKALPTFCRFRRCGARTQRTQRKHRRPPANRNRFVSSTSSASSASYLGDIAIAPAVARRNARRFGRTFGEEMRILILHGMLHLMGYDHETDSGQMDRRERRLRRALGLA